MNDIECGKQCCVTDTGALVNLCRLELGTKRAIEWVLEDFCVCVPQKIFDEGRVYLPYDDDEGRTIYFNAVQGQVRNLSASCEEIIDRQVDSLPPKEKSKIDAGEKKAAALTYEFSRIQKQYVLFVTNDFKAIPPLDVVFARTQTAFIKNAFDLLFFIASRHPDEIPLDELGIAIRELNRMIRDPDKDGDTTSDQLLLDYLLAIQKYPGAFSAI